MKKLFSMLILVSLLVSALAVFPVWAAEGDLISTDKTEYVVGEPILVTAVGSGTDWVGLYLADDYPQTTNVGGVPSIWWYYVAQEGNASGDTKNIFAAEHSNRDRPSLVDVPAGDYKVVLLANDGYEVLGEVFITVREDESQIGAPSAPTATYKGAGAGKGHADGTVSITVGNGSVDTESYVLRWGNANGALGGYTVIGEIPFGGEKTTYEMAANTLIPAGADRILVYACAGGKMSAPATVSLPAGAGNYDFGDVLYELQVMSDIHINASDNHIHNKHFAAALADIKALSPNSLGIFVNGDVADHGQQAEYDALNRLISAAGEGVPPVYAAIGNHDHDGGQSAAAQIAQFLAGTGNDSETVYFDRTIDGVHFVFLGSETAGLYATLSRAQLDWLEETLEADKAAGRPVFLFLHQGIMDTVSGTMEYQGWHGINSPERFKKILKEHPEVILFSGHSHWVLESRPSLKLPDDKLPTILNTSSCAYLWDDECMSTNVGIEGSQGYYIYVYEDKVVFRGRNFDTGEWIASAQFVMDWTLEAEGEPTETTEAESTPVTEPDGSDTADVPVETDPVTAEVTTVADTESDATDESDGSEGGCSSALMSGALVSLLGVLAAAFVLRRRDE